MPQEIIEQMDNIKYGWKDKYENIHYNIDDTFSDNYVLQSPDEVLHNKVGVCWDQVELERAWFEKNNFEYKTYFEMVNLDYENNYSTHTFLIYREDNKWYYFENADYDNKGIFEFNTIEELLEFQKEKYIIHLKEENIKDEELDKIIRVEYEKPNNHISASEYIEYVLK